MLCECTIILRMRRIKITLSNTGNMSSQVLMCIYRETLTKSLRQHILLIGKGINFCTKFKTHYDILKISPNATHNEIKSAYYKLTIKYHPDKNKSPEAKQMFQEILNAYEVLGSFKLRQQYDKSIASTHRHNVQTPYSQPQSQASYRTSSQLRTIYNFDEWTRQHYKETFQSNMKRRNAHKQFVNNRHLYVKNKKQSEVLHHTLVALIVLFCFILFIKYLLSIKNTSWNRKDSDS